MKKIELFANALALTEGTAGSVYMLQLKTVQEDDELLIPIGTVEAEAIMLALEKTPTPRPMTHEIIKRILDETKLSLREVVIYKVDKEEKLFYALLHVHKGIEIVDIEVRPSDGIALAIRLNAPIYTYQWVLDEGHKKVAHTHTSRDYGQIEKKVKEMHQKETQSLEEQLKEAVDEENYEEAIRIRNKINQNNEVSKRGGSRNV